MSGCYSMANWAQGPLALVPGPRTLNENAKRTVNEHAKRTVNENAKRTVNENCCMVDCCMVD